MKNKLIAPALLGVLAATTLVMPVGAANAAVTPVTASHVAPVASNANAAPAMEYIVTPVLPESQDEGVNGFFSMSTDDASMNEELTIQVRNTSDTEQLEIMATAVNAYTAKSGIIQYTDSSMSGTTILSPEYQMTQHLDVPNEEIIVAPGEVEDVKVQLDVNEVEGTVLGGVAFTTGVQEGDDSTEGSINIKNQVNTIIGVVANLPGDSADNTTIESSFFTPMPSYFTVDLPIEFRNDAAVTDADIEYRVSFEGDEVFTGEKEISFAPMTSTEYSIPFEGEDLVEGQPYLLEGRLSYTYNGQDFEFPFNHEVTYNAEEDDPELKTLNNDTPDVPTIIDSGNPDEAQFPVWTVVTGLILLMIAGGIWWIIVKRKRNTDDTLSANQSIE